MKTSRRLLSVALLVLVTACGQPNALQPEPFVLEPQVDRGRASALAKAAVLTPNDLKGWTEVRPTAAPAVSASPGASPAPSLVDREAEAAEAELMRCLGEKVQSVYAAERETTFTRNGVEIESNAAVTQTVAQAEREIAVLRSPKLKECLTTMFTTSIPLPKGVTIEAVTATPVSMTVPDTETFAYAFTVPISGPEKTIDLKFVWVAARVEHTLIGLDVTTQGTPPDTAALNRLLSTVVTRVKAVPNK